MGAVVMGPFEAWATKLRLPWIGGAKGQAIVGGLAAAFGDRALSWATQQLLEHLPEYAADPASVGLIASERQIDAGSTETQAALATRLTYATTLWRFAGTPLGILLALYYAGFPYAVLVQQNGSAWQIVGTPQLTDLAGFFANPPTVPSWWQTYTLALGPYAGASPSPNQILAPGVNPWWTFTPTSMDGGALPVGAQQFNSRFAILFPGPQYPSSLVTWQQATTTFTGVEDAVAAVWPLSFLDAVYHVLPGPAYVSDGSGPIVALADGTSASATQINIVPSARFSGSVDVAAWQVTGLSTSDLARVQAIVRRWRPAKATCVGIYVVRYGRCLGWPVPSRLSDIASSWGATKSNVLAYAAA